MKKETYKNILGWQKIISDPSKEYKKWFDDEKRFIADNIKKNSKVLEVGCGDGRSLMDVLEVTKDITGIDKDITAIEQAKEKFKNFPTIRIIKAEGKSLPFEKEVFDFVTCMGTFANFGEEKYKILGEMKRVLKSEGYIIISVYSEDALSERLKAYEKINVPLKKVYKNGTVIFDDFGKDGISEQFSRDQLVKIFDKVNLKMDETKKSSIGYLCRLSKKL